MTTRRARVPATREGKRPAQGLAAVLGVAEGDADGLRQLILLHAVRGDRDGAGRPGQQSRGGRAGQDPAAGAAVARPDDEQAGAIALGGLVQRLRGARADQDLAVGLDAVRLQLEADLLDLRRAGVEQIGIGLDDPVREDLLV